MTTFVGWRAPKAASVFVVGGWLLAILALALGTAVPACADDKNDEFRVIVNPTYALTKDRSWIGIGYLGYWWSNDEDYTVDYLGLGTIWNFAPDWETWFVLFWKHTNNEVAADVDELRPTVSLKNYFIKTKTLKFYNMARVEYRILDTEGEGGTEYFRVRDRLGVEVAFAPAWYGVAAVEPFYRFDRDTLDPLRVCVGLGWVINQYVRAEFIYDMQFTRVRPDNDLDWTDNIWRLNFKVARQHGVLQHVVGGDADE